MAEPYAGGAGASLSLLFLEETRRVHINDFDPSLFSFWWSLIHRPEEFQRLLAESRTSMTEWRKQRALYRSRGRLSRVRKGFAAFYLNRCNRSGIIVNGGPIGGTRQSGKWRLGARFNKPDLTLRCNRVAEFRDRISVTNEDGIKFLRRLDEKSTFFFVDPPYFGKGPLLYLNSLDEQYHAELAAQLERMTSAAWVLTYDDCPEIRSLYSRWATIRPFSLRYVAREQRKGQELLIAPRGLALPITQGSLAIGW